VARVGFNFRSTSGYVTDASGDTYVLSADVYPTTRGGVTFGYSAGTLTGASNIDNTYDPKIAGYHYQLASLGSATFRIDLTGSLQIRVGAGDKGGGYAQRINIIDSGGTKFSVNGTNTAGSYFDASTTQHTAANWPASNVQSSAYTFATYVAVVLGASGTDYTTLAHIEVADAAAGGATVRGLIDTGLIRGLVDGGLVHA